MSTEQSIDPQLIEQTKQQIRALVDEIAQLSKSQLAPQEFYGEFLTRVVAALAAIGGAVWTTNDEGRLALQYQVNLNETKAHNRQTAEEIAELRGRILRNATEVPPIPPPPRRLARPMVEPQRQVPPPPRNDFKGIMAGNRAERRLIDQRALPPNLQQEPPPAIRGDIPRI